MLMTSDNVLNVASNGTTTRVRDTERETERARFMGLLHKAACRLPSFGRNGGFGDQATEDEAVATWGPIAKDATPYATAFNGQDTPEAYQIFRQTLVRNVVSGSNETPSADGLKSIQDLQTRFPQWADRIITSGYVMEYPKGSVHEFPAGTRLGDLTLKNLARLIWAVRESLPARLTGAVRNKYTVAVNVLMGATPTATAIEVDGVDAAAVAKVLAALAAAKNGK